MTHIISNNGDRHELPTNDPEVAKWLETYHISSDIIIDQLNNERSLQPLFDTAEDYTLIDLGANIGLFSLYAQGKAKRVIAVEPAPNTFNILQKITAGHDKIELLQGAASDRDGETSFFISHEPTINSAVNENGEKVTVNCYTVDSIMKKFNVDYADFVKCDIEGGETVVLTAESIAAVADKVGFWIVEVHQTDGHHIKDGHAGTPWPGNLDANRQQIVQAFESNGYTVECYNHDQLMAWK